MEREEGPCPPSSGHAHVELKSSTSNTTPGHPTLTTTSSSRHSVTPNLNYSPTTNPLLSPNNGMNQNRKRQRLYEVWPHPFPAGHDTDDNGTLEETNEPLTLQDRSVPTSFLSSSPSTLPPTKPPGATKGRRKIDITYIKEKNRRHITFSKRKAGIVKKANELSTLTGTDVFLLIASEAGTIYYHKTDRFKLLIDSPEAKLRISECLHSTNTNPSKTQPSDYKFVLMNPPEIHGLQDDHSISGVSSPLNMASDHESPFPIVRSIHGSDGLSSSHHSTYSHHHLFHPNSHHTSSPIPTMQQPSPLSFHHRGSHHPHHFQHGLQIKDEEHHESSSTTLPSHLLPCVDSDHPSSFSLHLGMNTSPSLNNLTSATANLSHVKEDHLLQQSNTFSSNSSSSSSANTSSSAFSQSSSQASLHSSFSPSNTSSSSSPNPSSQSHSASLLHSNYHGHSFEHTHTLPHPHQGNTSLNHNNSSASSGNVQFPNTSTVSSTATSNRYAEHTVNLQNAAAAAAAAAASNRYAEHNVNLQNAAAAAAAAAAVAAANGSPDVNVLDFQAAAAAAASGNPNERPSHATSSSTLQTPSMYSHGMPSYPSTFLYGQQDPRSHSHRHFMHSPASMTAGTPFVHSPTSGHLNSQSTPTSTSISSGSSPSASQGLHQRRQVSLPNNSHQQQQLQQQQHHHHHHHHPQQPQQPQQQQQHHHHHHSHNPSSSSSASTSLSSSSSSNPSTPSATPATLSQSSSLLFNNNTHRHSLQNNGPYLYHPAAAAAAAAMHSMDPALASRPSNNLYGFSPSPLHLSNGGLHHEASPFQKPASFSDPSTHTQDEILLGMTLSADQCGSPSLSSTSIPFPSTNNAAES